MVGRGPGVSGYEISSDRTINLGSGASTQDEGCVNCHFGLGGLIGARPATGHFWHWNSGEISSTANVVNVTGTGVALDGYMTLRSAATFEQGVSMGLVYAGNLPAAVNVGGVLVVAALSPDTRASRTVSRCACRAVG